MISKMPVWAAYRAECRPFATGCRQCGQDITRGRAYCSMPCSDTFQQNHFWNTARWHAISLSSPLDADHVRRIGMEVAAVCARCGGPARAVAWHGMYWPPEVNHKTPLNGVRPHFGCCHHQENLECVCHPCHVAIGVEQRAAGLIGKPRPQIILPIEVTA